MVEKNIEDNKIRIPFVEGLVYPVMKISKHFKEFLFLTGFVSLICSVAKLVAGQSFFCGILKDVFCSTSVFSFVLSLVVMVVGIGFYMNRLMCIILDGVRFIEAIKQKCFRQDIKAILLVILYFSLWLAICFGIYFLNARVPVDNWQIELAVFVGVSGVVILAVVLLINFVVFFRFLQKKNVWALRQTFWPIFDNIFKLSGWFLIYFLIFVSLLKGIFLYFLSATYLPIWIKVVGNEFFLDFVFFTIVAFFVLHLNYLSERLFVEEK